MALFGLTIAWNAAYNPAITQVNPSTFIGSRRSSPNTRSRAPDASPFRRVPTRLAKWPPTLERRAGTAPLGAVSLSSGSLDGSRRSALRAAAVLARSGMGARQLDVGGRTSGGGRAQARRDVRAVTAALIRDGGFCKYFDPLTGEEIGGATFSWTAAIALLLEATGRK